MRQKPARAPLRSKIQQKQRSTLNSNGTKSHQPFRHNQDPFRPFPAQSDGNVRRVESAPVVAIIGMDMEFYHYLPGLYPHAPENKKIFESNEFAAEITAMRNSNLQGAHFIMAARAVGLDCGPMSGFDNIRVDQEFFAGTHVRSNFLCSLGYADPDKHYSRAALRLRRDLPGALRAFIRDGSACFHSHRPRSTSGS